MRRSARLLGALAIGCLPLLAAASASTEEEGPRAVLVELFTSEGCSSCPPADALAIRLQRDQAVEGARVLVLAHHVDYWDRLGWRDPFASPAATSRQREYARRFRRDPYTPQVVVDGRVELVGSREVALVQAIRDASGSPKARVRLEVGEASPQGGLSVRVRVDGLQEAGAREPVQVLLALTEDGLSSDVARGENAGRHLEHAPVVRLLRPLGRAGPDAGGFDRQTELRLDEGWRRARLRLVAIAQERTSRRVLGLGAADLR